MFIFAPTQYKRVTPQVLRATKNESGLFGTSLWGDQQWRLEVCIAIVWGGHFGEFCMCIFGISHWNCFKWLDKGLKVWGGLMIEWYFFHSHRVIKSRMVIKCWQMSSWMYTMPCWNWIVFRVWYIYIFLVKFVSVDVA